MDDGVRVFLTSITVPVYYYRFIGIAVPRRDKTHDGVKKARGRYPAFTALLLKCRLIESEINADYAPTLYLIIAVSWRKAVRLTPSKQGVIVCLGFTPFASLSCRTLRLRKLREVYLLSCGLLTVIGIAYSP